MKNRRLATHLDLPYFYSSYKFKLDGIDGILYYLCQEPTKEFKNNFHKAFKNAQFMIAQSEYAPEQIKHCIFLGERNFRD